LHRTSRWGQCQQGQQHSEMMDFHALILSDTFVSDQFFLTSLNLE